MINKNFKLLIICLCLLNSAPILAFTSLVANDDTVAISSNSTVPATGNVTINDSGGSFVSPPSNPVGNYGSVIMESTGTFTYTLNSNSPAITSLKLNQVLTDVFTYTYKSTGGFSKQARLIIQIIGNPTNIVANNDVATMAISSLTAVTPQAISVKDNDVNASTAQVYLASSPIGRYGYLNGVIPISGVLSYVLDTTNSSVIALSAGQTLTETFIYKLQVGSTPRDTDPQATVTIHIYSQQEGITNQNVELEPNNSSKQATPLNSSQYMRGQLINPSDKDWYFITSSGNEIIHMELCPQGAGCYNQKAWELYVFDGDKLTAAIENQTAPLIRYVKDTGQILSTVNSDHMYLLYEENLFSGALIGVIDPCFGTSNTIDIGVPQVANGKTRNYFVAISSPLARSGTSPISAVPASCSDGSVVLAKVDGTFDYTVLSATGVPTTKTSDIIQQFIAVFPESEDQYTMKISHSGASPLLQSSPDEVTYNSVTGIANIPKVRVNGQLYTVQLQQGILNSAMAFDITNMLSLNETQFANPYIGTYNPANYIVDLPKVRVEQTGVLYSVKLLYHPDSNTLEFLTATPIQ